MFIENIDSSLKTAQSQRLVKKGKYRLLIRDDSETSCQLSFNITKLFYFGIRHSIFFGILHSSFICKYISLKLLFSPFTNHTKRLEKSIAFKIIFRSWQSYFNWLYSLPKKKFLSTDCKSKLNESKMISKDS